MEEFCLIAFHSGTDAAMSQQALRSAKVTVAMMPTPRGLTKSCGLSLRFGPELVQDVRNTLTATFPQGIPGQFFAAHRQEGKLHFTPME